MQDGLNGCVISSRLTGSVVHVSTVSKIDSQNLTQSHLYWFVQLTA